MGNKRKQGGGGGGAPSAKGNKRAKPNSGGSSAPANKGRKASDSAANKGRKPSKSSGRANDKTNKRTAKQQEQARAAANQAYDDVEVDDEDVEFFAENASSSSFLTKMDPRQLSKPTHPKAKERAAELKPINRNAIGSNDDDGDDMPLEKLEARPRKAGWENQANIDLTTKLPVKFMDGTVRQNKALIDDVVATESAAKEAAAAAANEADEAESDDAEDDDDELDSDVSDMEFEEVVETVSKTRTTTVTKAEPQLSAVDLRLQRAHRLAAKKVEIAQLCESMLESPEDAFKKNKEHPHHWSKSQQLHALCRDLDPTVKKLSMLSQLAVFLDILPDYRIRVTPTDDKQTTANGRPLKKAVQQMQDFEASLLKAYQTFLKFCAQTVTDALKRKGTTRTDDGANSPLDARALALAEVATQCLSELLKAKYAFNFHMNLIVALVPIADASVPRLQTLACDAIKEVFKVDKSGVASLEIVKQIATYVKQKEHRVKPAVIATFLVLPLDVTMAQGEDARKRAKNDRKKRRRLADQGDGIATGLKEAEAVVDKSERQKTQADILHELVLVYFRILKQATYSTALPAVLEGLAKFAFLINLDIMIDLLKVLKAVLRADILPLQSALQAVLTGLRTLQGPGQELMVDEKEFVDILYTLLRKLSDSSVRTECLPTALLCVDAVFVRRKEIVVDRVAAFIKRLLVLTLHLAPHEVLAVLAVIRSLFHRYAKLQQLLESDVDRVAAGEYRADVDDPDFTNPYSSALWELALLARHYHPTVASFARGTAELGPSLPNEYPKAMLETYNSLRSGAFEPPVLAPPRNALHAKLAVEARKQTTKRRQRPRRFYVRDAVAHDGQRATLFYARCLALDEPSRASGEEDADAALDFATALAKASLQ